MGSYNSFKGTVLGLWFCLISCAQSKPNPVKENIVVNPTKTIIVGANQMNAYLPLITDKSVAVVANQTSVVFKNDMHTQWTHLVDTLLSKKVTLKKVFAPEHGFRGKADAGEHVADGVDSKTGLPLISLHGKYRKPSQEMLTDIDVVVFDIQDVGVRFYTYIATLQLVMEACADADIPVIVLDRPNPNGGYVDGPMMEKEHTSFLGMNEIPLVYGMTIGEYATMINDEGWLNSKKKQS